MNYQFVVKQFEIFEEKNNLISSRFRTFICIENSENGILVPHPITNFIRTNYENRSLSINTLKKYAEEIKKFLNFLLSSIENRIPNFSELERGGLFTIKLEHGAAYLNHLAFKVRNGDIKPNSMLLTEKILTKFYFWLYEQGINNETLNERFERKFIRGKFETVLVSPFKDLELDVTFPKKEKDTLVRSRRLHDFGAGRLDLVNLFLRTAELVEPDIAFGIALQFYGGLRRSEVVNLLVDSVNVPKDRMNSPIVVKIMDNWEIIFKNYKVKNDDQVKNERTQIVFNTDIVNRLYQKHMQRIGYHKLEKYNEQPLFIHLKKNKKPITGQTYTNKFNKVKSHFLKIVFDNNLLDYEFLISKPWSSHIGRGIFTNLLTFYLGWNPSEIAIARGDSNIDSSLNYIEEQNIITKTTEALEKLSKAAKEKKFNVTIEDIRRLDSINE